MTVIERAENYREIRKGKPASKNKRNFLNSTERLSCILKDEVHI